MSPDNTKSVSGNEAGIPHTGDITQANKAKTVPVVKIPHSITVKHLAEILNLTPVAVVKQMMRNGIMANINQTIDYEVAANLSRKLGYQPKPELSETPQQKKTPIVIKGQEEAMEPRAPVVTVMGHVDHGKTRLLDAIRHSNVIATEAGEMTQHIGAYQVEIKGRKITFLDTPGHEAFTAMRARGARATDITILVVAADDGVKPQTIEAINHSRAAGVPIIVALNKIDKPDINIERVKQQLAEQDLLIEEWGGDVILVPVSAKQMLGIDDLLENILILAEMQELKANPNLPATGVIVEAGMDKTRGPEATVLVQSGTLENGNIVITGNSYGKIKAMFDDKGAIVKKAGPSTPVKIIGLNTVPQAGDTITVVSDEHQAKAIVQQRTIGQQEQSGVTKGNSLSAFSSQIRQGEIKNLNIILKTDVQGSIEPILNTLNQIKTDTVKINIVHAATGSITEGDVLLALASNGIIVGFNEKPEPGAKRLAEIEGVDIRNYNIIYSLTDDIQKAMHGMLEPKYEEVVDGHAEIRAIFSTKTSKIAGVYVTSGKARRTSQARVIRNNKVICQSSNVSSLKHFKDDIREAATGLECGITLESCNDFAVGDIIEFFHTEKVAN